MRLGLTCSKRETTHTEPVIGVTISRVLHKKDLGGDENDPAAGNSGVGCTRLAGEKNTGRAYTRG